MEKPFDFKKEYKDLYLPKELPTFVDIPEMTFIMVDGKGDPNNNPSYQESIEILYALSYTIKMSKMGDKQIQGYFEYIVPPLEGLWWVSDDVFDLIKRENWLWTSMIRQPDFVTQAVFDWAVEVAKKKKTSLDFKRARLEKFTEGQCVQALHIGPYATEPETVVKMHYFMQEKGLEDKTGNIRKHHEIYLSDPRKVAFSNQKTVLRHPVEINKREV